MSVNMAKASNFIVQFHNDTKNLEFNCQAVNIPGISLGLIQVSHFEQNEQRIGDSTMWNPLILTIICDEKFKAFKDVFKILRRSKNPLTGTYDNEYPIFDGKVILNTNKNNRVEMLEFKHAFFQEVTDLNLDTTIEDSTMVFSATIYYTYYNFIGEEDE